MPPGTNREPLTPASLTSRCSLLPKFCSHLLQPAPNVWAGLTENQTELIDFSGVVA